MKYVFCFFLLIWVSSSNAQDYWQWVRTAGALADAQYNDVATDSAGNIYVAGSFTDSVFFHDGTKLISQGGKDILIAKYMSDGSLAWARSAGGKYYDEAMGIAVNKMGLIAITGGYTDTAHFGTYTEKPFQESASPKVNVFVAKYSTDGNPLWIHSAGGYDFLTDDNYGNAVDIIDNGTVAVCGHFGGKMMFEGSDTITSNGNYDGFWAKYSAGGSLQWVHSGGGDQDNRASDIAMHENGDVFVAGHINGLAKFNGLDTTFPCIGTSDMFITAVKSNGDPLWIRHGGSIGNVAGASCIAIDKNSTGLVAGGQYTDSLRTDEGYIQTNIPGTNGYLAMYQNYGASFGFDEIRSFDGYNSITCLSLLRESFYIIASGISTGIVRINGDTLDSEGGNYMFGMDPNNSKIYYNKTIITNAANKTIHVSAAPNNSVYAAGVFRNSITLDGLTQNASEPNVNQAYLAKLGVTSSVKKVSSKLLDVYPNPVDAFVTIVGAEEILSIRDILGREYYPTQSHSIPGLVLNCTTMPNGVYTLLLKDSEGIVTSTRITIQR